MHSFSAAIYMSESWQTLCRIWQRHAHKVIDIEQPKTLERCYKHFRHITWPMSVSMYDKTLKGGKIHQYNDVHKTPSSCCSCSSSNCSSVKQAYLTNSTSIYLHFLHEAAFYLCSVKGPSKILLVKGTVGGNETLFDTKMKANTKALWTGIRYKHESNYTGYHDCLYNLFYYLCVSVITSILQIVFWPSHVRN